MQPKKAIESLSELPVVPSTIGTMTWNPTGDWRYLTPVVENKLAPCRERCPAAIPIPDYLNSIKKGKIETGFALLLASNPLPGLTGRLCYHPCQGKCLRRRVDRAVSVQEVERSLADMGLEPIIEKRRRTGEQVTIIGSGPLGLSCAFYLGCSGCRVIVADPRARAGGRLVDLSVEKLHPQVLSNEISRLVRLADIELETDARVDYDGLREMSAEHLVIVDPTGLREEFVAPARAELFNPFGDEAMEGDLISVVLPENLKPFKAPMVAHYIAAGRFTAQKILDRLLVGQEEQVSTPPDQPAKRVKADHIRIDHLTSTPPAPGAEAALNGEVERVVREAERCMSCGTCDMCLLCASFCPDASMGLDGDEAVIRIDLDHCKGCGICAYECPRGVITMEEATSV